MTDLPNPDDIDEVPDDEPEIEVVIPSPADTVEGEPHS